MFRFYIPWKRQKTEGRTQGLTHLLGRQGKHVWLTRRQLPTKNDWWDAPLAFRDLAEVISMTLTMGSSPICFHGGSLATKFLPKLPARPTPLSQWADLQQISTQDYQEWLPSHNSPPTRTRSTVSTLSPRSFHWADTQLVLNPRISPPFFQVYINTTRKDSSKNLAMAARPKRPYSKIFFKKLFLETDTRKNLRSTKRWILQELQTSFKNKAIRNLSTHQLSLIKIEVLHLGLNFAPSHLQPPHTPQPSQSHL